VSGIDKKGWTMISLMDGLGVGMLVAVTSFIFCLLILFTRSWHSRFSFDHQLRGPQKFHSTPVPRIGGVAIFASVLVVTLFAVSDLPADFPKAEILKLVLASSPLFFAGLLEDVTKKASVLCRLFAAMASALLASFLLGATLPRLDVWGLNQLGHFIPPVLVSLLSIGFTVFAVTGASNSINIIDGFNGLAGSTIVIVLGGLAFLAWQSGDTLVVNLSALGIGATIGFMLLNYPRGAIFLGDGGAYFLGFWMAETAVLLVARNPGIGTWQVLAVCAYPIIETLFSIYRKMCIRRMSAGLPDGLHFHMLVYRRVVRALCQQNKSKPWQRNSLVAPIIAAGVLCNVLLVLAFGSGALAALSLLALQTWMYLVIYSRLVSMSWRLVPRSALGLSTRRILSAPKLHQLERY
jgi:UDP-N-acetylmuramyl pentapeptide phosphotransferase/UDP-N-acetylglucosamine-1-phosphate transferase